MRIILAHINVLTKILKFISHWFYNIAELARIQDNIHNLLDR